MKANDEAMQSRVTFVGSSLPIPRGLVANGASRRTQPRRFAASPRMLFTGIVERIGRVSSLQRTPGGAAFDIVTDAAFLKGTVLGDSIAVNGACLTVTELRSESDAGFSVEAVPETLRRTNLGDLAEGGKVNLERSVTAEGRMGGHVVQGHVDCVGEIVEVWEEGDSRWFRIALPKEYMVYVVEKGYVAVDGTSLTVCDVADGEETGTFTFAMVPFTQDHVVQATKPVGEKVNIEVDIMGKYIERILSARGLVQ